MKYVWGVIAALAVSVVTIAAGHYLDYDMRFLAGWWSCLTWTLITKD